MEPEEWLAAYQGALQDIRDLKTNQWRLSHYGLLLQAAIVWVESRIETTAPCLVAGVLSGISASVFILALVFIHEAQDQIFQWRRATESLQDHPGETMAEWAREFGPKATRWCRSYCEHLRIWKRNRPFAGLFFGVQLVTMVLAISVIWLGKSAG